MKFSHLHLGVRDLGAAVAWFEGVGRLPSTFQNDRMASIPIGGTSVILDLAEEDSVATIAFGSEDCDADYKALLSRGASAAAAPEDQSWGARAAYIKGPGALTIELEQSLS